MPSACRATRTSGRHGVFAAVAVAVLGFGSALGLLACTAAEVAPFPSPPVRPSRPRWDGFDAARAWPAVDAARASRGHGVGDTLVEIHVSPEGRATYVELVAGVVLPVRTTVAAFHRSPDGAPASVYAMTKLVTGEWEFIVTEPDGALTARGALASCAGCHEAAPADHLFGVPPSRSAPAASSPPAPAPLGASRN